MKRQILIFLLELIPFFIFCQPFDSPRHCIYDDYSLTMSYNVCTNDDTTGFISFVSEDNMNIYKVQYHLHFSVLDTVLLNSPDTGYLVRFWYTDSLSHAPSNCQLSIVNCQLDSHLLRQRKGH